MIDRFLAALRALELDPAGGRALVAVSGGADSVALLDLLVLTREAHRLELVVAHADHGIHPDSAAVAESVRRLASDLGCGFVPGRLGLGAGAGETAAREARHAWLEAARVAEGAGLVFLAHHADDQVETVLLRALSGSAPAGLAGIPARRGRLVRPLLGFRHAELVAHCQARGLAWWEDPANRDARHRRAWIRHRVLPELRGALADVDASLLRLAAQAADDRAAWDAVLDTLPGLDPRAEPDGASVVAGVLAGYDSALARAVVRGLARRAGCPLGTRRAASVLEWLAHARRGGSVPLGDGWIAEVAFERLRVARPALPAPTASLEGARGELVWGRWRLRWRHEGAPARQSRHAWTAWLSPGEVPWVRAFRPGDRIRPLGGRGRRLVVREMQDQRVPRSSRAAWPLLGVRGETIWLPGICRADAALPARGADALRVDVAIA
jgi:tRNA(Ile)-lysidine synthase